MSEYRELQAALDAIIAMERHDFEEDHFPDAEYAYNDGLIAAMNAVAAVPAADVVEVRHGRWVNRKSMLYCSECGCGFDRVFHLDLLYCPHCGTRMDGSEDNNG